MIETEENQSLNNSKIRIKEGEDSEEPPDLRMDINNSINITQHNGQNQNLDLITTNGKKNMKYEEEFVNNFSNQNALNQMTQSGYCKSESIDIILYDQYKAASTVFSDKKCFINQNDQILLNPLIEQIKKDYQSDFDGALMSYFDSIQDMYIYCGKYPLKENSTVPKDTIVGRSLEIKIRTKKKDIVQLLKEEQDQKEKEDNPQEKSQTMQQQQKLRVKERKIGEVVEKVALWRRFYTGYFDEQQQFKSMDLDKAAQEVGISKKTLDDYLLQIRCGKKYGFNFNENLGQRIGILRTFVKKQKNDVTEKPRKAQ